VFFSSPKVFFFSRSAFHFFEKLSELSSVSLHNLSSQLDVAEEAQAQLSQVGQ
jgi:hypothetical protein